MRLTKVCSIDKIDPDEELLMVLADCGGPFQLALNRTENEYNWWP
jgi:hypothetical protein